MASADFLVYRNTESNPRPPLVRACSFLQSLLHLLIEPQIHLGRYKDVLAYPNSTSLICNSCSSVPDFAVWLPSLLGSPQTSLPLANGSKQPVPQKCGITSVRKGLTPIGRQRLTEGDASGNISCSTLTFNTGNLYFQPFSRAFS